MTSLRERKKAETRQRIADHGTLMFMTRGFDNVTIAEIAEAAGVSKVTVFNYFPRKEDIFFDRAPQAEELLTAAVRDREPGESPLRAIRRLLIDLAEERHPLGGFRDNFPVFWQTVINSPALVARAREAVDELQTTLTAIIATTSDDPTPELTAAIAFGIIRATYPFGIRRMLAGADADTVTAEYLAALNVAFDRVADGMS
ncbi:TetR/AcrR family transcriptional regulator [Actinocrispum sp. NPDC049592]|uniref:TetR/AcrR family transcriptional regulator n=1 Tax=Actinocrispum sp. NPDC049592 TaxID=3154835 RepID=UPI003436F070